MSRTSGSCSSVEDPHVAQASGSSRATVTWPSGQYHAGMRWPHQSCREMFQSRRLSSQPTYARCHRSGQNVMRPSSAASFAGPRNRSTATNHCRPAIHGSISLWQR